MNKWRKFNLLSWPERRLFLLALVLLPITRIVLRLAGFKHLQSFLHRLAPVKAKTANDTEAIINRANLMSRMIKAASRRTVHKSNCLDESLVLWMLLRRRGIDSDLRFGANKEADGLKAHAWVEVGGVVVGDAADVYERFPPFNRAVITVDGKSR